MNAVGVHIYAGGFTVGVSKFFHVLGHMENDPPYAAATSRANFPDIKIYAGKETWLKELKKVALVYTNPPCAVFSPLGRNFGKRGQWRLDPRLNDWRNAIDYSLYLGSDAFIGESVPTLFTHGREFAAEQSRRFMDAGYNVYWYMHDLKFHGLPQQRRRGMLIASKRKLEFPPMYISRKTIREVFAGVTETDHHCEITDIEAELLPAVPEWGSLAEAYNEYLQEAANGKGRPRFVSHRIGWEGIVGTVAGDYMFHPTKDRKLTVEEYAALCGYPRDYKWVFDGSRYEYGKTVSEIARAVMPPIAMAVAGIVKDGLDFGDRVRQPTTTLVKRWSSSQVRSNMIPMRENIDITKSVMEVADGA